MNYEYFTLLIAFLIAAGFLWLLEIEDRKNKKRIRSNRNYRTKDTHDLSPDNSMIHFDNCNKHKRELE